MDFPQCRNLGPCHQSKFTLKKFFAPHTHRPVATTTPKYFELLRQIATTCRKLAAICRKVEVPGLGITMPGHGRGATRSGARQTPNRSLSWPFL